MSASDYFDSPANCNLTLNDSFSAHGINDTYPADLRFNHNSLTVVLVYSALFVVAAVGNLTVFISLFRSRHRKSRISLMIRHLAIADLVVTFVMIPIEVNINRQYLNMNQDVCNGILIANKLFRNL